MKNKSKTRRIAMTISEEDYQQIMRVMNRTPHERFSRFFCWLATSMAEFVEQGPDERTVPIVALMYDVQGLPGAGQTLNPPRLIQEEPDVLGIACAKQPVQAYSKPRFEIPPSWGN